MPSIIRALLLSLLVGLAAQDSTPTARAALPPGTGTVYVSTTGSGVTCSQASPCTFGTGKSQMGPGKTLFMYGGTYVLGIQSMPSGTSWNAPVTIRNVPGEVVRIGNGTATAQRWETAAFASVYLIIEGDFVPGRSDGVATTPGLPNPSSASTYGNGIVFNKAGLNLRGSFQILKNLRVVNGTGTQAISMGSDAQLLNLEVDHNGGMNSTTNHGIYTHASRLTIDGGYWHDHWGGFNMHLRNSSAACTPNLEDTAATPTGCGGWDVTVQNVVIGPANAGGLLLSRGLRGKVINNIVYGTGGGGVGVDNPDSLIFNNTVTEYNTTFNGNANSCGIRAKASVAVVNNIVVNSPTGAPAICDGTVSNPSRANIHHNLAGNGVNAGFVNPATRNYRITSSSPAKDTGVNLAGVPRDFFGATRPVGPTSDIGMHEFGGATTCPKPGGDCDPPSVPANLQLTLINATQIDGDWPDSSGTPVSYLVYRCDVPGCLPTTVILSPVASSFSNTGLLPDRTYTYAASSVDANGNISQASNPVSMTTTTTPPSDVEAPSVPGGCAAVANDSSQITFACDPSTDNIGVTAYHVRRCTGSACTPTGSPVDTMNVPSHLSQNLTASTVYGFTMTARDAIGNVSGESLTAYATTLPAAPVTPATVLLLNNDVQDASGQGHHGTNTGVTFDAATMREGTHAGFWDATTDRILVPLTDFPNANQLTLALNIRPTSFPGVTFALGHTTTPIWANRMQLCVSATGMLQLGLGSSAACSLNPAVLQLALDTWYHVVLRLANGAYTLDVDGIRRASGSYIGLTTLAPTLAIGNNHGSNTQGFRGQIDAVTILGRVWSDAEVITDCTLYVPGCSLPPPPTFGPFLMASGVQGDGVSASANTQIIVTMTGIPDPAACQDLTQFFVAYDQAREPVITCDLTASTLTLGVANPPATALIPLALTYLPTAQQITLTNNTVPEVTAGAALQQVSFWCRPDGTTDAEPWHGLPNQTCRVPSPGVINLRVDLVNVGLAASPEQSYALYCDTDLDDQVAAQRITEPPTAPLGLFLHQSTAGVPDGTPRTPVLPDITGITAVTAGTLERNDLVSILPALAPNTRTEYEFSLAFTSGLPRKTIFHCGLRVGASGAELSQTHLATIQIDHARWFVQ